MPQVSLNQPAPNFSLCDYKGNVFTLAEQKGQKNVLLVFNRTFV
jgi:peroxiredoxin